MVYLSYELLGAILEYLPTRKKWLLRRTCRAFDDVLLQQLFVKLRKLQRVCKTLPGNLDFLPHEVEHFYHFLLQAGLYEGLPHVTEWHEQDWEIEYQRPHGPQFHLPFTLTQASEKHTSLYASVCGLMFLHLFDMHREEGVMTVCGTWAVYCGLCDLHRIGMRSGPDNSIGCGYMVIPHRHLPRLQPWYRAKVFRPVRMWEYQSYLEEAFGVYDSIGDIDKRCDEFEAEGRGDYGWRDLARFWGRPRSP